MDNELPVAPVVPETTSVPTPAPEPKGIPYDQYHAKLDRIKELEAENELLKSPPPTEDAQSDEGKAILAKFNKLEEELAEVKHDKNKAEVLAANPILKDKWTEFEEFRANPDNKGMNLKTAAKAYLVENGLFDTSRQGLEKPTGGTRQPLSTGLTSDQVKDLRINNFRKYQDMLQKGQIKVE